MLQFFRVTPADALASVKIPAQFHFINRPGWVVFAS
jgi:hypothetical protein